MSQQEKEQILQKFSEAYQAKYGKAPEIEESRGWYKVDDGKNMRLAQLAELAESLAAEKTSQKEKTKEAPATKSTAADKKKSTKAQPSSPVIKNIAQPRTSVESKYRITQKGKDGLTAKQLWQQKLQEKTSLSPLPRGF